MDHQDVVHGSILSHMLIHPCFNFTNYAGTNFAKFVKYNSAIHGLVYRVTIIIENMSPSDKILGE